MLETLRFGAKFRTPFRKL